MSSKIILVTGMVDNQELKAIIKALVRAKKEYEVISIKEANKRGYKELPEIPELK